MRNQVIALEYETDRVVTVRVPVPVLISLCGYAVDYEVSVVVAVKAADDVEQGGLARAALTENSDEFVVAQVERDPSQRLLYQGAGLIDFSSPIIIDSKHR